MADDKYREYRDRMTKYAQEGNLEKAYKIGTKAYSLKPSEKLQKQLTTIQNYLNNSDEDDEEMVDIGDGFQLYSELNNKIYPYQRTGILWLWNLFRKKKGGILGDDMGLGKTIQIIGFLSGLFDRDAIKHALIVMPVSLISNWENEFQKWAPGIPVKVFHGTSKSERIRSLNTIHQRGGVLLTTYGLTTTNHEIMSKHRDREFTWDYVILDEGHKIKNATKTTKALHKIPAHHRILLTGTPLQNNLKELWSLFDFAHHGTLLGSAKTFQINYGHPITRAREKDASASDKKLGQEISESLQKRIAPYFLRRTKGETLLANGNESAGGDPGLMKVPKLGKKNDFVIWLYLSDTQLKLYSEFLNSDDVQEILMSTRSPLVQLTVLKKITDHPRLLSQGSCKRLGLDSSFSAAPDSDTEETANDYKFCIDHVSDENLIAESGKLGVLLDLVKNLKQNEHRCLIFSQSCRMLNIIQRLLLNRDYKILRIDGSITSPAERQRRINLFQTNNSFTVFLLTTQCGGVGLTLTGADRVIIYDPSWNPATDSQAVDRVYRIGQDKPVVVYRLITCATVEEKIYRRQIFKESVNRLTTGDAKNPFRYFTKQELKELFVLDDPKRSKTQEQLEVMHSSQRDSSEELDEHVAFLYSLNIFGISDHNLMFTKTEIEESTEGVSDEYYKAKVMQIEERVLTEVDLIQKLNIEGEEGSFKYRYAGNDLPRKFSKKPVPPLTHNSTLERSFTDTEMEGDYTELDDDSNLPDIDMRYDSPILIEDTPTTSPTEKNFVTISSDDEPDSEKEEEIMIVNDSFQSGSPSPAKQTTMRQHNSYIEPRLSSQFPPKPNPKRFSVSNDVFRARDLVFKNENRQPVDSDLEADISDASDYESTKMDADPMNFDLDNFINDDISPFSSYNPVLDQDGSDDELPKMF